MTSTKLSILIPSFKRHGRLYRNILYFQRLSELNAFPELLPHIEIVIADGSPDNYEEPATQPLFNLLGTIDSPVNIKYRHFPGIHFFDRLQWLSSNASSGVVTLLGDEDLLALDELDHIIRKLNAEPSIGSYTGRYIDIHGFAKQHLKLSLDEGWIDGYSIQAETAKERLKIYRTLMGLGLSPVMYSILRRDTLIFIADVLASKKDTFTYVAGESVINHIQVSAGNLHSTRKPFILRDRTFIDRATNEEDWSDADRNILSEKILQEVLVKQLKVFHSNADANSFFKKNVSCVSPTEDGLLSPLQEYREMINWSQPQHSTYLRSQIHSHTYSACIHAWKKSLKVAYPSTDLRILGLRKNIIVLVLNKLKGILSRVLA